MENKNSLHVLDKGVRGGHRTRRGTETFPLVSASVLGGWGREVAEEAFRGNRLAGLLLLTAGYCIQLLTEASVSSKPGGHQGVRVLALKQESTAFPYVSHVTCILAPSP